MSTFPLYLWGCMAIAFTIPLAKKFVPGFIVLLGVYLIFQTFRKKKFEFHVVGNGLIILASIFLLHITGMLYSSHVDEGWNEIGIKLSFIVFPLIGWMLPKLSKSEFEKIIHSFIWGSIAFMLFALVAGVIRALKYEEVSYLSYEKLGYFFHPSYAAAYQALSLFLLLRNASVSNYLFGKKWIHIVICFTTIVFISMLASKAGLIAAVAVIVFGSWCWWKNKFSVGGSLGILGISLAVLIGTTLVLPSSSDRILETVTDFQATTDVKSPTETPIASPIADRSTGIRFVTWKGSWEILKTHPFGVGTGDSESALVEKYKEAGETYVAERKFNSHNQFFQSGVEHGWPGVLLLIGLCLWLLVDAVKQKNIIQLVFLCICGMNFLFESFLEVQAGIVFFCFMVMIFNRTKHHDEVNPETN
ncbi:MAG: O-antigen ligase family protein [Flavobacteriales bacterium]